MMFPWLCLIFLVTGVRSQPEGDDKVNNQSIATLATEQTVSKVSSRTVTDHNSVSCYTCDDCEHVAYNTTIMQCPMDYLVVHKRFKCVVSVEKFEGRSKPFYVRSCATSMGTCDDIREKDKNKPYVQLMSCVECEGDLCNGVSRSLPLAFLYFIVTPILFRLALS